MTIKEFCYRHNACDAGRRWAMNNCATMQEAWDTCRPDWLVWIATRPGVLSDRDLRLAAVQIARTVQHLMTDPRSLAALSVAERYAHGQATDAELDAARAAAWDAAWDASWDASNTAKDAVRAAAWTAVRAAVRAASWAVIWATASAASNAASNAAARAAARDAARKKHAAIIRQFAPNFEGGVK